MIDFSEDQHEPSTLPAVPPPPDDTIRSKRQQIAAISPHRMKRIRDLLGFGRDPGAISRMLSIPVSTIIMVSEHPEMIEAMRSNPMNLGGPPVFGGGQQTQSYAPGPLGPPMRPR
jgi:hypothetical protein